MTIRDILRSASHEPIMNQIERPGAERNVLAYVLRNPDSIYDVASQLTEADFNNSLNKKIFQCMSRLSEKGVVSSVANILAVARANDILDQTGEEYLRRIGQTDVSGVDVDYNSKLVLVSSIKRQAYLQGLQLLNDCVDEDASPDDADTFIGNQQQRFMDLSLKSGDRAVHIAENIDEWLREKANNPNAIPGIKTGFTELDDAIGGFRPGRAYTFAARSKVGKSLLLNNFAIRMAVKEKIPILYLDTEMDTEEDVRPRLMAIISGVSEDAINNGTYTLDAKAKQEVEKARDILKETPFYHAYVPNFNVTQIASIVRKYYVKHKIQALFFDYIKTPTSQMSNGNVREYLLLGQIMATLKGLAGDLKIPVITACQLSRDAVVQGRSGDSPDETTVGGSDRILHNTSYLFYFWRKTPEQIIEDGGEEAGNLCLKLGQSRHGGDYFSWLKGHPTNARISEIMKL